MPPHRSRTAWPERPQPKSKPTAGVHDHRLPRAARLILAGLVVIVVFLGAAVGALTYYTYQLVQYAEGVGEYRDREQVRESERLEQRITDAVCDLLDQLPEGGLLERPRAKYGCGPGYPREEFGLPPAPGQPGD